MSDRLQRVLVVMPSWVGDVVMATPALRAMRERLPGALIGGLMRPGLDELMAGCGVFDQVHVDHAQGVMGPKRVAQKLRMARYDTAVLMTNSFSTALIARLAWIPRRIGYDRDGRGLLLTDRLRAPVRDDRKRALLLKDWAPVSAVRYYVKLAECATGQAIDIAQAGVPTLGLSDEQEADTARVFGEAELEAGRYVVLNPGASKAEKRWPAQRYVDVGAAVANEFGVRVAVSGSPNERELTEHIATEINAASAHSAVSMSQFGLTLGSLKGVVRGAALMVTNDTGPRHIARAFGVPTVAIFGPTDPRWTVLPAELDECGSAKREVMLTPRGTYEVGSKWQEVADDDPSKFAIERVEVKTVLEAVREMLSTT